MADLFRIHNSQGTFLGTGVLVAPEWVLTCKHVVETGRNFHAHQGDEVKAKVQQVIRHPKLDLALLKLNVNCGEPDHWSHQVADGQPVNLSGFRKAEDGTVKERDLSEPATPHREGGWVVHLECKAGVLNGMSGGIGVILQGRHPRIVGLIQEGGKDAPKSLLAGAGQVAPFLAAHGLPLPGCPEYVPVTKTDTHAETRTQYLKVIEAETAHIHIKYFQQSNETVKPITITDLYVKLKTEQGADIEALVARHRFVVLQGDAGSGKSTCLQALAHTWASTGKNLPFLVKVVDLDRTIKKERNQPKTPVRDDDAQWLPLYLAAQHKGLSASFCTTALEDPKTVVLLDGLDEALTDSSRASLIDLVGNVAKDYPRCRFVLTTRPGALPTNAFHGQTSGFAMESIAPLESEAVETFIANWSRCIYPGQPDLAEDSRKDLARQVNAIKEVREMANSPMTLTALAVIHRNGGTLPHGRAELFASILSWMAKQRGDHPGRWKEADTLKYLRALAFAMQTEPAGRLKQVDIDRAPNLFCQSSKLSSADARDFLLRQELDTGILVRRGENLEFRHLLFQEYLAAKEFIVNRFEKEQRDLILETRRRYSVEWREFLRLVLLQVTERNAQRLYSILLDGAGQSLADKARTIALIRQCVADRKEQEDQLTNPRYLEFVKSMAGLFRGEADGQKLDIWSRAQAAEAWELLVGDTSRLPLPSDEAYWAAINDTVAIGRFPVAVFEYALYLADYPAVTPPGRWREQKRFPQRPVVYVSFHDASAYCQWVSEKTGWNIKIPTEEQWYLAASGETLPPREFPWGDQEPDAEKANYNDEAKQVTPVGLFPAGATPDGRILDLAGNVWEWTSSPYSEGRKSRVLRGGSFYNNFRFLRSAFRDIYGPVGRYNDVGFRCVREVFP